MTDRLKAEPFDRLEGIWFDRPAIILCGGPTLPDQFDAVRAELPSAVLISANHHGAMLMDSRGQHCDYIVAMDNWRKFYDMVAPHDFPDHPASMLGFDTPIIGPKKDNDLRLVSYPNLGNTGLQAAWCAFVMGCKPLVLCGADCFDRDQGAYWHDPDGESLGFKSGLDHHLEIWHTAGERFIPPELLRAAGGPLVDVFGAFDPAEAIVQQTARPVSRILAAGVKIEFTRNTLHRGEHFGVEEIVGCSNEDAKLMIELGKAKLYEEGNQ